MPVHIAKVNGMGNFVILKFELNAAPFQFVLGRDKISSIGPEREM